MEHEVYIEAAVRLARESVDSGGGPFGAVVLRGGVVVGRGMNRVTVNQDPTAHAELVAIRDAAQRLRCFDLGGCVLYASCEPCPMCLGAIFWSRIDAVYYAATAADAARAGFPDAELYEQVCLSPQQRRLPMVQIASPHGRDAFEAWRAKEDRIEYS